ncbi:alpha/beta hydrolase [Seohaeicola saemankumensis]|nr:alpha/beta fold hydrolase [Seohaeicola saemankumensis]MCA0871303.1 alpha/beta hydrolase [Seohaeicola saemankumensis]
MIGSVLKIAALSGGAVIAVALGLVLSDPPRPGTGAGGLDFSRSLGRALEAPEPVTVPMRDGYGLQVRDYPGAGPLVIMVHGSGWNGLQFDGLAPALRAHVLVPDLRGHGAKPGRRGDVDYIGQFEDDLADLIAAYRLPGQKLVLVGHSSGGGLVVRFAGGPHGEMVDAAVLLAPFLKHDAPVTRPNSGGWARVQVRRLIGLSVLNTLRIRALNHLPVISFNMPDVVLDGPLGDLATTRYSYRLNVSYAPRSDYLRDVAALPPFLLLAGAEDEAFVAEGYTPLMSQETDKGRYIVVPAQSHLSIVDADATRAAITGFLDEL